MKTAPIRRLAILAGAGVLALSACGPDSVDGGNEDPTTTAAETTEEAPETDETEDAGDATVELSGSIAGSGASSIENAQGGWIAGFADLHPNVTVNYDPTGSGTGREQFLNGAVLFAGSDSRLKPEEQEAAVGRCFGGEALELPLYISPIAIVYNLPSVDAEHINIKPTTLAKMFTGEITKWNDPELVESNPDVELPDLNVIPVNRSDKSGTTGNFTDYLAAAAPNEWTYGSVEEWPISGTQSGAQTQGMIDIVAGAEGTIGYADASRVGDLGTVAVGVGDEYVPFSPEAAAAIVDASPGTEDATDLRLTIDLARDTTESGTYPVVLISYLIACSQYDNESDAANVAEFFRYIASVEGQERAARPDVAGSAPISDPLRERVNAALDQISVAG